MTQERIVSLGQKAFGICIICVGIQQLAYGDIAPNFLPPAFSTNVVYRLLAYPWGIVFTLSGIAYLIDKKGLEVSLISGGIFLVCLLLFYVPYILFFDPKPGPFQWAPAISTIAFTGSSFIMASSYLNDSRHATGLIRWFEKLAPFGGAIFAFHLIFYGAYHFIYGEMISTMVPVWIPSHLFWTYLTGAALISAGVAIALKIKLKLVATLLAIMLFTWCIILHVPRAIANPVAIRGLELTRVFVSFGFTGTALLLAYSGRKGVSIKHDSL